MNNIFITIKKELRSIFRDKKTISAMFVYPLMIPLMVILYGTMYDSIDNETTTYKIGTNYTFTEEEKSILNDLNLEYIENQNMDSLSESFENNEISGYISYDEENKNYTLYYDASGTSGMAASELMYVYLETYSTYLTNSYLVSENIDLDKAYNHFTIDEKDLSNNNYVVTILLGVSLTYIILSICMATSNMAIGTTATEKENGTLETILTFPIKKNELIVGKYLSSVIVGFVAGLISLILMIISMYIGKYQYTIFENIEIVLSVKTILSSIITVASASIFIAGVALLLTAFAKSYKEAQGKISFITLVATIPMFISILDIKISKYYYLIPICNFEQVLDDIFTNNIVASNIFLTFASTVVYSIAVISIIIKAYNSEKILFTN